VKRILLVLAALVLTVPAVLLVVFQFGPIWPNLAASYICTAPLFAYTHLLRRQLKAQDEALAETHRKVGEMHEAQTTGRLPKRLYRPDSGEPPSA
jgi:hypothetical protein